MDAIVVEKCGGTDVLQLRKVDIPTPGKNEILIRIKAAGVNPCDVFIRTENPPAFGITLPYTPGVDAAGVVESVGAGVSRFKEGDRVFTTGPLAVKSKGAYAQYGVFRENGVFPLPSNVEFAAGASIGIPHFTAYKAVVLVAKAKPTDSVLIHGASGAVGQAAVQVCRALGIKTIIGTAGTDEGMKAVKESGATHVYNHRDKHHAEQIQKEVGEVNVIIEMSANNNLEMDLDLLVQSGIIVLIGGEGPLSIAHTEKIFMKMATIQGMGVLFSTDDEWKEMGSKISEGLKNGTFTTRVVQSFPLADAKKAHEAQEKSVGGGGATGNIVLLNE